MKSIYKILGLAACMALTSCYKEDELVASDTSSLGRFEFPQGDNSWDSDILDIYNEFGVRLIYKDITESDFTKSWTGGGGGGFGMTLHGSGCANDDMTQFYVTFMKEHIFHYLTPSITERVFPMYWYLAFDFYGSYSWFPALTNPLKSHSNMNFMDAWLTCFWGSHINIMDPSGTDPLVQWMSPVSGNKESYTKRRFLILNDIIETAIERGNITIPEEFDAGFDHSTTLNTGIYEDDKADPNYYLTRGYPGNVNTSSAEYAEPSENPTALENTFIGYIQIAMRYTAEEREEMFPSATYTFTKEKFDYVQKYMKDNYNIDLEAIAQGPKNWDIIPYPELPSVVMPEM